MSSRKATVEPLGDFVPDVLAAINFGTVVLIWSSSPGSKRCCLCSTGLLPWLVSSYSWEAIISRVDIHRPLISFLFVSAWWWLISVRSPPATWRSARSSCLSLHQIFSAPQYPSTFQCKRYASLITSAPRTMAVNETSKKRKCGPKTKTGCRTCKLVYFPALAMQKG
jgi:hypothetical protein